MELNACKRVRQFFAVLPAVLFLYITGTSTAGAQLPPRADAGPDQIAIEGGIVRLDGSGSTDPNPALIDATFQRDNLPGGTSIEVALQMLGPDGGLVGTAAIGEGQAVAQTAIAYILDLSGSANFTGGCGGDQNNDGLNNRIIDCEIAAALALHQEVISSNTVSQVGLVTFSTGASVRDLNPTSASTFLISPDADVDGNGILDLEQTLRTLRTGGSTNFRAAVVSACNLLAGAQASNRLAVFISDGLATTGGAAINVLPCDPPVQFEGFAIGSNNFCTSGAAGSRLQQIADATGGSCTNVPNISNLPDILPNIISARLTHATLSVDGAAPVDISLSLTPPLPLTGPANASFSAPLPALADGIHEVCITVFGEDALGQGSVETCSRLRVGDAPLSYAWELLEQQGPPLVLSSASSPQTAFQTIDDGTYLFQLTVTNGFGLSATDQIRVTVDNSAPTLNIETGSGFAGGVTLFSASLTDPGYIDTHSAQIDWGDGTIDDIPVSVQGSGWGGFFGSHIYAEPGLYDVLIVLSDDDGGTAEAVFDQFLVAEPVALWANSPFASRSLDWSGAAGRVDGRVHTNNELRFVGQTKTVNGQATYAGVLSADTDRHIFTPPPHPADVQDYPIRFDIEPFRPGGAVQQSAGDQYFDLSAECVNGIWHETQVLLDDGVYFADCDVQLNGSQIGGRVTVVSEGTIKISGSRPAFEPFYDGLLFLAGGSGSKAIDIATSDSRFLGVIFAEFGEIEVSGSYNHFFCGILGDRIDLSGGALNLRGANCGRPDSTVAGPLLVPSLSMSLSAAPADVLPGQSVDFSLSLSHDGASLVVPGLLGLENVDAAAVSVSAYAYVLEYFSIADQAWIPFASLANSVDGYTPSPPLPNLGQLSLTLRANPTANVQFPATGDAILATLIEPSGFATWGTEAVLELPPALLKQLLDPLLTGGIRNRVRFDLEPSDLQVRRLFTTGSDFIEALRTLGDQVSSAEITLTQPTGDPIVFASPALPDPLQAGDIVSFNQLYTAPVIAPRSGGETDAAYLARLVNADNLALYGSASARASAGVGLLTVPLQLAFATQHVPALALSSSGPELVSPGERLEYAYTTRNLGSTDALALTLDNQLGGDPAPVTPPLPAALTPGQIVTAAYQLDLPVDGPVGSLRNLARLSWNDAAGNTYGTAEAEIVTTVAAPAALQASLRDGLQIDADANGLISPGDTIGYTAVIRNNGDLPVSGVQFVLNLHPLGELIGGSATTSQGSVVAGNNTGDSTLSIDLGIIAGRSEANISFATLLAATLPDDVTRLSLQGTLSADGLADLLSDDPDLFGLANATVTQIAVPYPVLSASLSVTLVQDNDNNGVVSAGDGLAYTMAFSNGGTAAAVNTLIEIPVPASTQLVAGSVTTSVGEITSGLLSGDSTIKIAIPSAEPDRSDQIEFRVTVSNPVNPPTDEISTRAMLSADNAVTNFSDDPNTAAENDATAIAVVIDGGIGGGGTGGGGTGGGSGGSGSTAGQASADFNNGLPGATLDSITPVSGSMVSAPTNITAQLSPPAGEQVVAWTVSVRVLGSTELIEIASGSGSLIDVAWDPTVYANGLYGIVIDSETSNGGLVRTESYVTIEGDIEKPGRLQFTVSDLEVSIQQLPVRIQRSYDSFNLQSSDFGFAWSLDIADFSVQTNGFLGDGGWRQEIAGGSLFLSFLDYVTDKPHFVVVTWPDGTVERFDLRPAQSVSLFPFLSTAQFAPLDGATSRLEALDNSLFFANDGNLYGGLFGSGGVYNPQRFRLTDRLGTQYILDRTRGLISATDSNGNILSISSSGIVHSQGIQVQFERDSRNRITRITDSEGGVLEYAYDAIGNLVSVINQDGEITNYEYDPSLIHHLVRVSDGLGNTSEILQYDANGRVIGITDALGATIETQYDPDTLSFSIVDRRGFARTEFYDESGNLARIVYPDGSNRQLRYEDPNNPFRVTAETDENGQTTQTLYTSAGDLRAIIYPDGNSISLSYDAGGRITHFTDPNGNVRQLDYDAKGNVIRYVDEEGQEASSTYDSNGRITRRTGFSGEITQFEYASNYPFPSRIINPDGSSRDVNYDLAGRLTYLKDENGNEFRTEYTQFGNLRLLEVVGGESILFEYENDRLVRLSTTAGGEALFTYDALDRLIRRENELGNVTTFGYDENGNQTSITDENGNTTQYVYDARNRLIEEIDPLGKRTTLAYDPLGQLIEETDSNGRVRRYAYDVTGNLISETWLDALGNTVRVINTRRDANGNVLSIDDGASRFDYQYDRIGRVVQTTDSSVPGGPWVLNYQYALNGYASGITDQTGVSLSSAFNDVQLVNSMEWSGPSIDSVGLTFDHNPLGEVINVSRFRGGLGGNLIGESRYRWNNQAKPLEITHADSANTPIAQFNYVYDSLFRLQSESGTAGNRSYAYDANDQLISATSSSSPLPNESYVYDPAGNPLDGQIVVGAGNRLLQTADETFSYDNVGNMVRRSSRATGDYTEYGYDHLNQLSSADIFDSNGQLQAAVRYQYDVYGRVTAYTSDPDGAGPQPANTHYRTYSGADLWADLDVDGNPVSRYMYLRGIDQPVARYRPGEGAAFYLTDRQGSVRAVIDDQSALLNTIDYDSYGVPLVESNPLDDDRLKYTAREYDSLLGLYDYRSRHYDPELGRFVSPDSVGFESGDLNLYRYVFNTPHQFIDPLGTSSAEYGIVTKQGSVRTAAAAACVRNVVATLAKEAATELLTIYVIQQFGGSLNYVGRTGPRGGNAVPKTELRFSEHLRTKRFAGGLEKIGEFTIRIPQLATQAETDKLIRLIEQEVIEEYGGTTKLLNARNEINANDYRKFRKILCGK